MHARYGFSRSNTAVSPPTMIDSVPSFAAWAVRATGASAKSAPRAANAWPRSRASATGVVLMSTTVWPERTRATRPSGPRPTARTCGSPGRHMKTISARAATSAAEPAPATPSPASAASGSARWSNATTAAPDFLARLRHMASPITPSPMNPSVVAIVVLLPPHVPRRPRACQARRRVTRLHYATHEYPGSGRHRRGRRDRLLQARQRAGVRVRAGAARDPVGLRGCGHRPAPGGRLRVLQQRPQRSLAAGRRARPARAALLEHAVGRGRRRRLGRRGQRPGRGPGRLRPLRPGLPGARAGPAPALRPSTPRRHGVGRSGPDLPLRIDLTPPALRDAGHALHARARRATRGPAGP